MDLKKVGLSLRRWAPLVGVLLLSTKTVAESLGATEIASALGLAMNLFGLGVADPQTATAVVTGVGAIYAVVKKLTAKPA